LEEASLMQSGRQLRALFAIMLTHCTPAHPDALWIQFRDNICDDLLPQLQIKHAIDLPTQAQIWDFGLFLLDELLQQSNSSLSMFPPMPLWERNWASYQGNQMIAEQLAYDCEELKAMVDVRVPQLNDAQAKAYNDILDSVHNKSGKLFFLNGAAGTGKTFVYNTLAMKIRSEEKIVICVASSGIAAQLLVGGRTAHSTFKIPLDINDTSLCSITKNSKHADLLRQASLIIWDEIPMQHRFCAEAVDRTLRDILDV
jgi:hypothetical protein